MRWFILFILFFTTVSYSQDVLYGKRVDFNFLLTHEVFKEADSLNINFDQVHISFVVTKDCKAETSNLLFNPWAAKAPKTMDSIPNTKPTNNIFLSIFFFTKIENSFFDFA